MPDNEHDSASIAVQMDGITKRFPGVLANGDVDLDVRSGEIHAVVGENGAGKSTLMKILYGMQPPDEGSIAVNGESVEFHSPKDAIAQGIGMVHQHFMLADNLTVLENVVLGDEPMRGPRIDFAEAKRRIDEIGETYGLGLRAEDLVETLTVGERQRVEIMKVLFRGARILILDEPTAVLVPQEVDELFANLQNLVNEGETIIFISHKLDEVLTVADRITVMRRGRKVATVLPDEVDAHQLAELMVGSELPVPETRLSTVTDEVELRLEGVGLKAGDDRWSIQDISFAIHRGEVVGIAGVEGNGQQELIEAIVGINDPDTGTIHLGDTDISHWPTLRRREQGIGLIPSDRHREALLLPSPLWENSMLGHQSVEPSVKGFWINRGGARERAEQIVETFDVRTPGVETSAGALSGGNQQKFVVGREMLAEPSVLVASHPTRGIDVGAQAAVWEEIRNARAAGLAVLLISADLDELIGLSDTLYVIYSGKIVAQLDPAAVTPEELGGYMTGMKKAESA